MSSTPQVHQTINGHFGRVPHDGVPSERAISTLGDRQKRQRTSGDTVSDTIKDLLGDMNMTQVTSRNLDVHQGYPHTTTGIPYSIAGRAKVINQQVGEYLAKFVDPIKTILSTNIHEEAKIMIVRKYVVGGRAMVTPEHAPARTVAVQEDVREVHLTRFGGDVEMNLNLFLRKDDAKAELDMKIGAQRRELERTLVDMGYDMLMTQGTDLVDAVIRSSPLYSTHAKTQDSKIIAAADRINVQSVFGAMSKHAYPVQNLLAAARYASAYTTSNDKGSVLILPHGVPDILRYTRRENMVYEIAGPALMSKTNGKKISMEFEDGYVDPSTSVRIVIHRQLPNFDQGTAHPDVSMGGLTSEAAFATFHEIDRRATTTEIVDLENGTWRPVGHTPPQYDTSPAIKIFDDQRRIDKGSMAQLATSHYTSLADAAKRAGEDDVVIACAPHRVEHGIIAGIPPMVKLKTKAETAWTSFAQLTHAFDNQPVIAKDFYAKVRRNDYVSGNTTASFAAFQSMINDGLVALNATDPAVQSLMKDTNKVWRNVYVAYCAARLMDAATFTKDGTLNPIQAIGENYYDPQGQDAGDGRFHDRKDLLDGSSMLLFLEQYSDMPRVNVHGRSPDNDLRRDRWLVGNDRTKYMTYLQKEGEPYREDETKLYDKFTHSDDIFGDDDRAVGIRCLFGRALYRECGRFSDAKGGSQEVECSVELMMQEMCRLGQSDLFTQLLIRPRINAMMSSAILAAPGESTGSLLVGYPFTSVSTSSQEMVKIQMRVYLGSVLRSPESVIVLRDVYFEGLKDGFGFRECSQPAECDMVRVYLPSHFCDKNKANFSYSDFDIFDKNKDVSPDGVLTAVGLVVAGLLRPPDDDVNDDDLVPQKVYCGATRKTFFGGTVTTTKNTGHMGSLDHPDHTARLWGSFVYDSTPNP